MCYQLLTGATGLLGNYLLRDLLTEGVPVAVVVRSQRRQSARQRIENLLLQWDRELGRQLPRPVVLEGDISREDLGLNAVDIRWVAEHCSAMIHNAASLTFHATSEAGEPWSSNVQGTRNVLEFCRQTRIRKFYHVSTAYVAGLRNGTVLETELDVGQTHANDYERSKLLAEKMVHEADFLDTPTFFRPGIIIGDSRTGFTTTYHGFYAALQLAYTIVSAVATDGTGLVGGHSVRLALSGDETKNLVPVEWVSAVMAHVIRHPEWHGRTYHLTPRHPVTTRAIKDALELSGGFYGTTFAGREGRPEDMTEAEALFYEHIRVYDSYWRMDPVFDRTNTELAAPHLPCPHVSLDLLVRMSRKVIADGFPTPSKKPSMPKFDTIDYLEPLLQDETRLAITSRDQRLLGLDVHGHGGGQWQLVVRGDQVVGVEMGIHEARRATCELSVETFADLAQGKTTAAQALRTGRARISGNGRSTEEYADLLQQLITVSNTQQSLPAATEAARK